MKKPLIKKLTKSLLESIETENILYTEVTPLGAMGNAGGIIIYLIQEEDKEMICYEVNIDDEEEIYLLAEDKIYLGQKHFNYYYGGMGNNVFINKKINLAIGDAYFIYNAGEIEYQILPSVKGVFTGVVHEMNSILSTKVSPTKRISPQWIENLEENEVFVFGSNLEGMHGGGAAALAKKWGAIWGQGVGLQGQTYAIPTMQGGIETIQPYVTDFVSFAKAHPQFIFLVTEIGCGIAGFSVEQMAPLFQQVLDENIENIFLPERFYKVLTDDNTGHMS